MREKATLLLLFGGLFAIFTCTSTAPEAPDSPASVVFLNCPADTSLEERGIDAVPEGDMIQLQWIVTADVFVSHYAIYRSRDRTGPYQIVGTPGRVDSLFLDGPLQVNVRYYYYIVAVTEDGRSSEPSDTLDYRLLQKAVGLVPAGLVQDFNYQFSWQDPNLEAAYVVRLLDESSGDPVWIAHVASTYSGDRESVQYNFNTTAALDSLVEGNEYRFRIDVVSAAQHCGSESEWSVFKIR